MNTFQVFLILFAVIIIFSVLLYHLGYIKVEKVEKENETKKILTELNEIENATESEEGLLQEEISPNMSQLLINETTTSSSDNIITTLDNIINQTKNEIDTEINLTTIDELFI